MNDAALDPLSPLTRRYFDELRGAWAGSSGSPPANPDGWVRGEAGSTAVGTHVRFFLRETEGRVTHAAFQAYGCPHTLAACSWLTETLVGQDIAAHQSGEPPWGAPEGWRLRFDAPTEKLGRLLIVEDALRNVLQAMRPGVVE